MGQQVAELHVNYLKKKIKKKKMMIIMMIIIIRRKDQYTLYRRLRGPRGRSGHV
jgi:hypothetical protein